MDNWLEHEARYQYGAWPAAHLHRLLSLTRCDGRYGYCSCHANWQLEQYTCGHGEHQNGSWQH